MPACLPHRAILQCPGAEEAVGERVRYVAAMVERNGAAGGEGGRQPRPAPQVLVAHRAS